ncbi:MAG: GntR family transcriptional regulator [Pseudomonadota bacterium]
MTDRRVDNTYEALKAMAVGFEIKPGDRLNEVALSRELGVSRTPLREALNRLVSEKLFDFKPGSGFYCRALDPQTVFELFEMRVILETASVRLAAERAPQTTLIALQEELFECGLSVAGLTVAEACRRDENFHMGIARASGNSELTDALARVNERIRYIRWVRMAGTRIASSKEQHKAIAAALVARDATAAASVMSQHIESRKDQITAAVREGISNIYLEPGGALAGRMLESEAQ